MERERLNYWIDVVLLISFLIVAVTGLVMYFAFVSASPGEGRGVTFLGTSKTAWIPWHDYSGIIMIVFVLAHLVLHFNWLKCMTVSLFRKEEEEKVVDPIQSKV
jgi:cytochrome b subunit of formate dehydrogenase